MVFEQVNTTYALAVLHLCVVGMSVPQITLKIRHFGESAF